MHIVRVWLGLCCVSGLSCASPPSAASEHTQKVDLLFVIDNSATMLDEQAKLAEQVPRVVEILTTGRRSPNDPEPFEPILDLHVGVVSSDMGLPGTRALASCAANGGDAGHLKHSGARALDPTCAAEYPRFLSYEAGHSDPAQLVHDVRCVAQIGTGGCSVEQPLEAALQALSVPNTELAPEFGGNAGFLRNDANDPSLLVVVLLTDEDDCSIADVGQFTLNERSERDPDLGEDLNQGCLHGAGLQDVRERYLKGLRGLRPGREELVVFLAIAGIPPDLVDDNVLADTDFADPGARDRFFDAVLKDSRMQPGIQRNQPVEQGIASLRPSCVAPPDAREVEPHLAFPAPRIVELAKAFGENAMVQSICSDSFSALVDPVVRVRERLSLR